MKLIYFGVIFIVLLAFNVLGANYFPTVVITRSNLSKFCLQDGNCTLENLYVTNINETNVTGIMDAWGYKQNGTYLDDIYVNEAGDNMTGYLSMDGNNILGVNDVRTDEISSIGTTAYLDGYFISDGYGASGSNAIISCTAAIPNCAGFINLTYGMLFFDTASAHFKSSFYGGGEGTSVGIGGVDLYFPNSAQVKTAGIYFHNDTYYSVPFKNQNIVMDGEGDILIQKEDSTEICRADYDEEAWACDTLKADNIESDITDTVQFHSDVILTDFTDKNNVFWRGGFCPGCGVTFNSSAITTTWDSIGWNFNAKAIGFTDGDRVAVNPGGMQIRNNGVVASPTSLTMGNDSTAGYGEWNIRSTRPHNFVINRNYGTSDDFMINYTNNRTQLKQGIQLKDSLILEDDNDDNKTSIYQDGDDLVWQQTGGTNEDITWEWHNNFLKVDSTTGLSLVSWDMSFKLGDTYTMTSGTGNDFRQGWDTGGTDKYFMGVESGAGESGIILIGEYNNLGQDYGHAVQNNPTLYIHSATNGAVDNEYIGFHHDTDNAVIDVGKGNLIINNTNLTANFIYGEMFYNNDTATSLNFAVADTYYPLWFTNATHINGFDFNGGNQINSNLSVNVNGIYKASYSLSGTGQNNHEYHAVIFINDIEQEQCESKKKMTAGGDITTMNGECFLNLIINDKISVRIADKYSTGTGEYYNGNLNLFRIGE